MDSDLGEGPLRHPFEDYELEEESKPGGFMDSIPRIPDSWKVPKIQPATKKAAVVLAVLLAAVIVAFFIWPSMQPASVRMRLSIEDTEGNAIKNNKITFQDGETKKELFSDQGEEEYPLSLTPGPYVLIVSAPDFKTTSFTLNIEEESSQTVTLAKDLGIIIEQVGSVPDIASGETKQALITLRSSSRHEREVELLFEGFGKLKASSVPKEITIPAGGISKATILLELQDIVIGEETKAGTIRIKYTHESFPLTVKLLGERKQ